MKGIQNKKGIDLQKPSCMARMVDFFEFTSLNTTNLLTEIPHKEVVPRNFPCHVELGLSEEKQNQDGRPMKMLIEEEMWREESETNQNPPSVVARLMGLNEFPQSEIQNSRRNKNSRKVENSYEMKMELIRQKFAEAKSLATNEKLFHSREFQDALQFLSSNRDLFVKFLEEPNSLFANNTPVSPEIKHITVLKPPEKMKKLKNGHHSYGDKDKERDFANSRSKPLEPTRIVVLKPNLEKNLSNINKSRSIYANGYNGDISSFRESMNLYEGEEMSDLDVCTPTSWDYNSKIESPFSLSSQESRVVREAKKRLVERWEMVASNSNSNSNREDNEKEEKGVMSTLGEMLTIHEIDKKVEREVEVERESTGRILSRSISLPVSFQNEEVKKTKSGKGSFRWKISSLFFSKNNNNNNNKGSLNEDKENDLVGTEKKIDVADPCTSSCRDFQENSDVSTKEVSSTEQEPSPISVLEPSCISDFSDNLSLSSDPISLPPQALCRSGPIGSIARSLSWDSSQFEIMSPNSLRLSKLFSKADEEQDSFTFIQKLVSFSKLERREKPWFSLETPLDSSLFYEFLGYKIDQKDGKERLLFDSVNEALVEIEKRKELAFYPWSRVSKLDKKDLKIEFESCLSNQIWGVVRNWCTTFERYSSFINVGNYEVESVAKKEVSGTKFEENKLFEMFDLNLEICGCIIEELVDEFILEF